MLSKCRPIEINFQIKNTSGGLGYCTHISPRRHCGACERLRPRRSAADVQQSENYPDQKAISFMLISGKRKKKSKVT